MDASPPDLTPSDNCDALGASTPPPGSHAAVVPTTPAARVGCPGTEGEATRKGLDHHRAATGTGREDTTIQNLRVQTLSGRSRVVYTARSGGANFAAIVGPSFDVSGKHLYWARRNLGSASGNRYIRLTLASGRLAYAPGTGRLYSTSWINGADGFASVVAGRDDDPSAPGSPTTLTMTGRLSFAATP
jgi:hypothetical protein